MNVLVEKCQICCVRKSRKRKAVELRAICRHANTRVAALVPWPWAGRKGQRSALFLPTLPSFLFHKW
uniref:Uncharacterized protein n=1 Tax=Anguilla anguilla TaxID=7936 RepID=A0A0E9P7Y1_ANGAN